MEDCTVDCEALGPGWQRQVYVRRSGQSMGHIDVYYLSPPPQRKKYRSKRELEAAIGDRIEMDHFNYRDGRMLTEDEIKRQAERRKASQAKGHGKKPSSSIKNNKATKKKSGSPVKNQLFIKKRSFDVTTMEISNSSAETTFQIPLRRPRMPVEGEGQLNVKEELKHETETKPQPRVLRNHVEQIREFLRDAQAEKEKNRKENAPLPMGACDTGEGTCCSSDGLSAAAGDSMSSVPSPAVPSPNVPSPRVPSHVESLNVDSFRDVPSLPTPPASGSVLDKLLQGKDSLRVPVLGQHYNPGLFKRSNTGSHLQGHDAHDSESGSEDSQDEEAESSGNCSGSNSEISECGDQAEMEANESDNGESLSDSEAVVDDQFGVDGDESTVDGNTSVVDGASSLIDATSSGVDDASGDGVCDEL